ncbi:MAG: nitroreductase family protein [archaeon]
MDLDKVTKERHSCRRFTRKKPDWRDIVLAINSARTAPTAGNIPTIKYILVDDSEKIAQLAEAATQDFVAEAQYVVVVCTKPDQCVRSYGERGKRYFRQQTGAAIQNFLLKITELGLATCWVGAFVDDMVKYALQIPEDIEVEAMFPIGYERPPKSTQRKKPDLDMCLYFNVWKNKHMVRVKRPEAV